ncbi:META domain-containing protein [Mangrovimonas spongiae]|uniref:META domain-containing protein n=1 Tax=Mangrovimonas spongiae TaxID=2494697 RepID=A0A3R9NN18_9FLAO|nr:META domain-containing protein [Mangrovimonas spongiae]RSK39669.1 META domain-containing protein [Mangrovimonas spongiae]
MKALTLTLTALVFSLVTSCNDTKKNTEKEEVTKTENITETSQEDSNTIAFTDTKWQLISLNGTDIANSNAFISFATQDNRVFGNAGCNNFTGTYKLKENTYFELSPLAVTKKMCVDMSIEESFLNALETADNYILNDNKLIIQKTKTAPLAVFIAVE